MCASLVDDVCFPGNNSREISDQLQAVTDLPRSLSASADDVTDLLPRPSLVPEVDDSRLPLSPEPSVSPDHA